MQFNRRIFLASCLSAACAPALARQSRDTLVAAFPRPVRTLDGNYANLRENDILGLLTDDALFAIDPIHKRPVPLAARAYEFKDPTTLHIDLRDDILFHDGSKMTPSDVVYTYRFLLSADSQNSYRTQFARWLSEVDTNGSSVVFKLKQPYALALHELAMYAKIRKDGCYVKRDPNGGVDRDAQALTLNGTGPYRVVSFRPGQKIELERFEAYRTCSKSPAIRRVIIRMIPDWGTQAAEVIAGGVDWTFGVPSEIAEGVTSMKVAQVLQAPSMRVYYLSLDATGRTPGSEPLRDVRVRRAINHAVDRDGVVGGLLKGASYPLHTACDPVQFGCAEDGITRYGYDPIRSKALLADAGYPDGFSIEVWGASNRPAIEAIANQLGAVGISATARFVQGPTLAQARRKLRVPIEFTSSGSFGIPDAGAILLERLGPSSPRNFSGDAALGERILAANATLDEAERSRHFAVALGRISDQAYWVPLWSEGENILMSPDLAYRQAPDGMPRLYTARWN
jgi:peptide/nickel transport system substrate-binding protein